MKTYPIDKIRNVVLLGHGGAGKTSVLEAMLYDSKAIDRMGKVSDGNTVSDFDEEEGRRGISINTSYAAVEWDGRKINVIDAPGDFDFLGDQQLAIKAGDIALIVLSAKDGVSVGAEKAMRFLEKKQEPVAFLVNRLDEPYSSFEKTVDAFQEQYGKNVVPLAIPVMEGEKMTGIVDVVKNQAFKLGQRGAMTAMEVPADLSELVEHYREGLMEQIAETSEELMNKYFEGEEFTKDEIENGLMTAIQERDLFPVYPASATQDWGISFLMNGIVAYFPTAESQKSVTALKADGSEYELECKADGPLAAFIFKTIVDPFVGRISLLRIYSGVLKGDEPTYNANEDKEERMNGLFALRGKKQIPVDELITGDIGAVTKLVTTQTNETLSLKELPIRLKEVSMPVPVLTRSIVPVNRGEEDKIMQGLNKLADEDKSFAVRNDKETHQLLLCGQGEVQLDVLVQKLKAKFGTQALLEDPRVPYRETIRKKVKVQGKHKKQSGGHGQYGDVWVVFEPGDQEELEFREEVVGGAVPKNYFPAVEKGLQEAVSEGVLAGYPVVNLRATLVDGSYHEVDSNEMSFKLAARLAYRDGLPKADPVLLEPISTVKVHIPDDYLGDIMGDMSKRRGRILGMGADSDKGFQVVEAECPTAEMSKYATDLKSMTQGRGWYTIDFARYEQAPSDVAEKVIAAAKRDKEEE